ncbi:hypothetical protein P7K49_035285, partial [Saguinus oedipus]
LQPPPPMHPLHALLLGDASPLQLRAAFGPQALAPKALELRFSESACGPLAPGWLHRLPACPSWPPKVKREAPNACPRPRALQPHGCALQWWHHAPSLGL